MKALILLALIALAGFPLQAAPPPNIVVVLIDDMGSADLSCFGNTDAATPHIDRLAGEGLRFKNFYVNSPICSPSRTALTTGQYPQRWRITSYLENRANNQRRGMAQWLDPAAPSLARLLQSAGYATGHFGKWHMGGQRDVDDAPPISRYGFDESLTNFEGMGTKLLPLTLKPGDTKPGKIWQDSERLGGPVVWKQRSEITAGFVDAAIPFIDRATRAEKPFYINLWPDDVHSPFWPPVDQWKNGKRGLYLSVLEEMDRQLGRLFDHIRQTPALRDNTIIILCSDNGHEPGAGSSTPFRGSKGMLYEGGIRSPLIVWAPGQIDPKKVGLVNQASVFSAIDLAPSLLKIAQTSLPVDLAFDGEDLSATLLGKGETSRKAPIFWRRPPDRKRIDNQPLPDLAIREGKWKLLCNINRSRPELYNLETDPGETQNLAETESESETTERLTDAVIAWHRSLPPDGQAANKTTPVPEK